MSMDAGMISAIISGVVLLAIVVLYILTNSRFAKVEAHVSDTYLLLRNPLKEALDKIDDLHKNIEELGGPEAPPVRDRGSE